MAKDSRVTLRRVLERVEEMHQALHTEIAETRRTLSLEILDTRRTADARADGLEGKLDAFHDETHGNFDDVYRRFDRLETEYYAISAGLSRVEKKISEEPQA